MVVKVHKEGDHRKAIAEHLIAAGLLPLAIAEKSPTREDAFITITQENVSTLAGSEAPR
jgi:hypothetical protein